MGLLHHPFWLQLVLALFGYYFSTFYTVHLILTLTILFYSILQIFYAILFYSVFSILYSILSCCAIFYYALFCILFYNVFYSILFYLARYSILFYSILCSILSIISCKLPNFVNIFLHRLFKPFIDLYVYML